MHDSWRTTTVADCASSAPYSTQIGPFGDKIRASTYTSKGAPVLRGINVNPDGRFHDDDFVFIDQDLADREFTKFICESGDVILCHKGTLGKIGLIPHDARFSRYIMGNSMMKVRCEPTKLDSGFLYYWLCSPVGQHYLYSRVSQVGVPQIQRPLSTLREAQLLLPPLSEQLRIVQILGALDDKIELNRKMNQTLEEMAQAIFKSWFIDFDGQTEFVNSELGRIPKGWRATSLGQLCAETAGELRTGPFGTSLNSSEYTPRGTPVVAVRDIKHGYLKLDERTPRIPPEVVERLEVYRLLEGDILFGRKGAVERSALVPRHQASWLMGSDCIRLRLPSELCPAVWAIGFRTKAHTAWMVQHATGSTMASLNQRILNGMPCVVPPKATLKAAESLLSPLLARENANRAESETLSQLRDTLLPKLISGEIRIRDAEESVEEVT